MITIYIISFYYEFVVLPGFVEALEKSVKNGVKVSVGVVGRTVARLVVSVVHIKKLLRLIRDLLDDPELFLFPESGDDLAKGSTVRHVDLEDGPGETLLRPHTNSDPLSLHVVNLELPGDVVPLGEQPQLHVLLVDVHPHAEVAEERSSLWAAAEVRERNGPGLQGELVVLDQPQVRLVDLVGLEGKVITKLSL